MAAPKRSRLSTRVLCAAGLAATLALPAMLRAQMVVSGRVTVGSEAVEGATVGIPSLDIETRTSNDGRYNFLVRAAQVRGQVVTLTARHRRFGSQSVAIQLTGGTLVRDFTIGGETLVAPPRPSRDTSRAAPVAAGMPARADVQPLARRRRMLDSTSLEDLAGPLDVASGLAGRIPGLIVTSASALGGSAPMVVRGPRSISGSAQPLVVLDGVPLDRLGFGVAAQQVGLGGFDYGLSLQDLALDDIATVTLLDPASAALHYGSRAAHGVIVITTKSASATGFQFSVRQRYTEESATRLPSYQNRYGQGLGGQFEFFDGMGGGVNDDIEQSWGPALDGQPIAQASLAEPRRAEVRHWLPHGSGVGDYLARGRTYDASATLSAANARSGFRLGVNARDATGLTPNTSSRRLGVTLGTFARPTQRLSARANLLLATSRMDDRPGTGYDGVNPIAGFLRFGRQVDLAGLRAHIRNANEQINWIYTGRNNPWFQAFENSNRDTRTHLVGGAVVTYDLTGWLNASLRGGIDDVGEERRIAVADGWKGGFPTALGRGDYSGGGTQRQSASSAEHFVDLSLNAMELRGAGFRLGATAGIETRRSRFDVSTHIVDRGGGVGGPESTASTIDRGTGNVTSFYLAGTATRASYLLLNAGARVERSPELRKDLGAAVFPAASATYDVAPLVAALRDRLGSARLRASWWRSGTEVSRRSLGQSYVTAATPAPMLGFPLGDGAIPERTTGIEVGTEVSSIGGRAGLGFTYYSERSSELLFAVGSSATGLAAAQTGEISNRGIELELQLTPYRGAPGNRWDVTASFARNINNVEKLAEGLTEVPLSPSPWGAGLVARAGSPVGAIVGRRYLRDAATGALIVRNGLPLPDGSGPLSVLGSWRPDWTTSLLTRTQIRGVELSLLLDARRGGKVFSATNLWGSYAGTLESTVANREVGIVVPGIDSVTGAPNSTTVTAEDYFHALGAIHEPWVYDASYLKLRESRLSYETVLRTVPGFSGQTVRVSLIGRNLVTWAKAPNIDPETALSGGAFQGFEMGQLPTTRSIGIQVTVTP